jgi:hypothetical protein
MKMKMYNTRNSKETLRKLFAYPDGFNCVTQVCKTRVQTGSRCSGRKRLCLLSATHVVLPGWRVRVFLACQIERRADAGRS